MENLSFKLRYRGSIFWLIFWLIIFFPLAFVLLLTDLSFEVDDKTYSIFYHGSRFWLGFWVIFLFPVAFVLLLINGVDLNVKTQKKVEMPGDNHVKEVP